MTTAPTITTERADLLRVLGNHRNFLRFTARDLTDEQAGARPTVSELCIGGVIKHVANVERTWVRFIENGPSAFGDWDVETAGYPDRTAEFSMVEGDTLAGLLAEYEQVAAHTDELVRTLPDLDAAHPLPKAPWFEAGAAWTARRVLLHVVAETSQHAGHADIIRETLDGAKTMG